MTNPTNPGAFVQFFIETTRLSGARQVSFNPDGWKVLASNRKLIPFIFWESAAPDTVIAFQLINTQTGKIYTLSTSLIDRRKRADNSKTWYIFDGSDIGETIPCGTYRYRVEFVLFSVISEEIEVINALGPEYMSLLASACASDVVTITATDTIATGSTLLSERFEYRISDETAWTEVAETGTGPYTYQVDMSAISLPAGENLLIRRTVTTSAGNTLITLYALDWDSGDPCGSYALLLVDDLSTYPNGNIWYLELADSVIWEDKIYEAGFVERVYLKGHWDFPEPERELKVLVDNTGNRVIDTADTREFLAMVFEKIPDQLIYLLSAIGDYSSISLNNLARNHSITGLVGAETTFAPEDSSGYYRKGKLRFRNLKHFERAYLDGESTSAV